MAPIQNPTFIGEGSPLLSILNKQTPFRFVDGSNGLSLMELELVENIKHNYNTTITQNPADAKTVNDNIKNEPVILSMVCRISDNPVSLVSNLQGTVSSLLPPNPISQYFLGKGIEKLSNELLSNSQDRKQDFFDKLIEMRENKKPFSVVTGLKSYENMIFKSIEISEEKNAINCLVFSCVLEQINLKALVAEFLSKKEKGLEKAEEIKPFSPLYDLHQWINKKWFPVVPPVI